MMARTSGSLSNLSQIALMALRYLGGRKLRTTLTTLSIVFGVALIFAVNLVLPGVADSFGRTMSATAGSADLSITSITGEAFDPAQTYSTIKGVKGVAAVSGLLRRPITLPTAGQDGQGSAGPSFGKAVQIEIVGVDPTTAETVRQFLISEGRFLQPGDTGKAIVPAGLAEVTPQLKVGATFPLMTTLGQKQYTVVGWLAEKGDPNAPQIIIPLADAQAVLNQHGLVNTIDVAFKAGTNREEISADVRKALGEGYRYNAISTASTFLASLEMGYAVLNLMGIIALFLGAFLIFNTFRAVVVERRRDLAMLRAIGATRRHVTTMILVESLIQGVVGTIVGLAVGYGMSIAVVGAMSNLLSQFGMATGEIGVSLSLRAASIAVGLGLATTLVAGYWPARAAGRISPLAALRPATTADTRRAGRWALIVGLGIVAIATLLLFVSEGTTALGALLFLVGMVVAAPGLVLPMADLVSPLLSVWFAREGDLARGNVARQPGRAAITASTLMIGLGVFVLIAALVLSLNRYVSNQVERNFSSDMLLMPPMIGVYGSVIGADEGLAMRLRGLPQVETASGLRYAASSYNGQPLQVLGIDPADYPKVSPLDFTNGEPEEAYAALGKGRAAVVNSLTAASWGLQPGDDVLLQTAEGPKTYRIAGVANDMLHLKISAFFVSQASLKADFHKAEDVLLMIKVKPGADTAATAAEVQRIAADYPQFTVRVTGEYRDTLRESMAGAFMVYYALGVLILIPAALGLLNTLTINVLERTREIGVVRAVGGSRSQVRRLVLAEALLLGLFGAATGVVAGVAMSYGVIAAFGTLAWQIPYEFPVFGIFAAIAMGILLALFASILPARNAAKLDIIKALQYE